MIAASSIGLGVLILSRRTERPRDCKMSDAYIAADEFEGSKCDERGERVCDRRASSQRKPCCGSDHRLLANANVDKSISKFRWKVPYRSTILRCHHDEPFILCCDLFQEFF